MTDVSNYETPGSNNNYYDSPPPWRCGGGQRRLCDDHGSLCGYSVGVCIIYVYYIGIYVTSTCIDDEGMFCVHNFTRRIHHRTDDVQVGIGIPVHARSRLFSFALEGGRWLRTE